MALHESGSNNPDGIEIKKHEGPDGHSARRHPVPSVLHGQGPRRRRRVFLIVFSVVVFFVPDMGGYFLEAQQLHPANPLKTPEHIAPVWYFTPYYAMLRAVPSFIARSRGVLVMGVGGADLLLPAVARPLPRSSRSAIAAGCTRCGSRVFVVSFLILGYLGMQPPTGARRGARRIFTILYFAFFLLMPFYSRVEKTQAGADEGDAVRIATHCVARRSRPTWRRWLAQAKRAATLEPAEHEHQERRRRCSAARSTT